MSIQFLMGGSTTDRTESPAALAHFDSDGHWTPYQHLMLINRYLLKLERREITRLIIEAPIRHGKTTLVSEYFPAWWMSKHPSDKVMMFTYSQQFAASAGRRSHEIQERYCPQSTDIVAAGILSELNTSAAADLVICDSTTKDLDGAHSKANRDAIWAQWEHQIASRILPKGVAVVATERWHRDDLAGRLQSREPGVWDVLRLPALSEGNSDPLGRARGAALCPQMRGEAELESIKRSIRSQEFKALYQQAPVKEGL